MLVGDQHMAKVAQAGFPELLRELVPLDFQRRHSPYNTKLNTLGTERL